MPKWVTVFGGWNILSMSVDICGGTCPQPLTLGLKGEQEAQQFKVILGYSVS